ncbi:class I SAM-dependent methyltransferase [Natrinema ejinorense]|uniref:Methyltransferase type 11 n=1 Tax=Natrinema ejinorense TaxID=373386 RepID=A0A2A5QUE6_9EURY|nr:methyltransferase domain-containing protein [Natrinema ejinorense]PCR90471.1 hypothetical protein CP557_07995 [Natrinema ejinorense]
MSLTAIYRRLPSSLQPVAKQLYMGQRWARFYARLPYARLLDRFRLNDLDDIYTEEYFLQRTRPPHDTVAETVIDELVERYDPDTVADIGCAIGHYLLKFQDRGIETTGFEGSQRAVNNALVDTVQQADLRDGITVESDHNLVTCIEVAEHLHPIYADNIVNTIVSATGENGTIVFTAAPPGQYGTHHINLKPRRYWIEKFEKRGVTYCPEDSKAIINSLNTRLSQKTWPVENIMVFRN